MQKRLFTGFLLLVTFFIVSQAEAAAPDGSGPWADTVVSTSQGLDKSGNPIPAIRSDASQALGVAEQTDPDGTFYSLGFGGSITLGFDTPFNSQVIVIETTRTDEYYPNETALVEVSADNANWIIAGTVTQDGEVSFPEDIDCAAYIRITDTSDPSIFQDATADGYDVDGVKTLGEQSCQIDTEGEPNTTPTPTPSNTPATSPTPTNNETPNSNPGYSCDNPKPGTPTLSANRTSNTTVELRWNAVNDATHYAISYGTSPGNYSYGVANTGNTTSFTIGGLATNTAYYFTVRAVNDCQPGDSSNEVADGSTGLILGLSTDTNSSSRSQILGLSTENLAATGTKAELARISLIVLSGITTGLFVFTRLDGTNQ